MNTKINNRKLLIIVVIALGALLLYANKNDSVLTRSELYSLNIQKQFKIYPEMKTQDLYKSVHQASMGSEHAVKDPASAQKWLHDELANMKTEYQNKLYDTLTPGGKLVRVNLRPFRNLGYSPALLVNAFVKTANNYKRSIDSLKYIWSIAIRLADEGSIPLNKSEMISFFNGIKAKGFPVVHHSELYKNLYHPAYRVVASEYLDFIKTK